MQILFPDTTDVEYMDGCRLRPGRALVEPKPVLVPTIPSEGGACYLYGSVIKSGSRYKMWYQTVVRGLGDTACLAVSNDGREWTRELFNDGGTPPHDRAPTVDTLNMMPNPAEWERAYREYSARNNIAACLHNPVVFAPDNGDTYPGLYKIFGFTGKGYVVGFSEDGRRFHYSDRSPVIPLKWYPNSNTGKKWANDVGIPFWDSRNRRYVGLIKTYEIDEEGRTRRCIGFTESPDLIDWEPVRTLWAPGSEADEIARADGFNWADFYGMPSFPYGNGYLGLLWIFRIESELPKGTHLGKIQPYLAWSMDAQKWELVSREPIIANPPNGEWGCGTIYTASLPVREDDHERIYFGAGDALHGAWEIKMPSLGKHPVSIGFATLPKNGFCRLWAEDGEFGIAVPGQDRGKPLIATFSEDAGNTASSNAEVSCGERIIFSGPVAEGARVKLDFGGDLLGGGVVKFRLSNAGVYALETAC